MDKKSDEKEMIINNTYLVKKKISAGSFGTVYTANVIGTSKMVAVKLERNDNDDEIVSVIREGSIINKLQGIKGIPKVYWTGTKGEYDILVIQLLGRDIGSYLKIFKKFSKKTVAMLGEQLITLLEHIHAKNVLHRDIKPENILMGREEETSTVFFVDFGISKLFRDSKGKHIPYKEKKSFIGTTRYASIAAHVGCELSRKDDLESLAYVLIFFMKGMLPWQNLNVNDKDKTKKVGEMKQKIPPEELCAECPEEFVTFLKYVRMLNFTDEPNYGFLKGLMHKIAINNKFTMDYSWDWTKKSTSFKSKKTKEAININIPEEDKKEQNNKLDVHKLSSTNENYLSNNISFSKHNLSMLMSNNNSELLKPPDLVSRGDMDNSFCQTRSILSVASSIRIKMPKSNIEQEGFESFFEDDEFNEGNNDELFNFIEILEMDKIIPSFKSF